MLIDHRTYRILSGHWNNALTLITQIRQLSRDQLQFNFEILSSHYGPFQTIALEFPFDNDEEQVPFFHEQFYPALNERGWLNEWFSHVMYSDSHNLKTVDRDGEESEKAAQAPRPGMLVHRHYFEPVKVGDTMNPSLDFRDAIREQYQSNFRITRHLFSGVMTAVYWEFCSADHIEQQNFLDFWYSLLTENNLFTEYASHVRLGRSELWYSIP
jgi:hypothetical protein